MALSAKGTKTAMLVKSIPCMQIQNGYCGSQCDINHKELAEAYISRVPSLESREWCVKNNPVHGY